MSVSKIIAALLILLMTTGSHAATVSLPGAEAWPAEPGLSAAGSDKAPPVAWLVVSALVGVCVIGRRKQAG